MWLSYSKLATRPSAAVHNGQGVVLGMSCAATVAASSMSPVHRNLNGPLGLVAASKEVHTHWQITSAMYGAHAKSRVAFIPFPSIRSCSSIQLPMLGSCTMLRRIHNNFYWAMYVCESDSNFYAAAAAACAEFAITWVPCVTFTSCCSAIRLQRHASAWISGGLSQLMLVQTAWLSCGTLTQALQQKPS